MRWCASSSPTGMGVSTPQAQLTSSWTPRASSSPTGMGVSTRRKTHGHHAPDVRPRHRRGWESQRIGETHPGTHDAVRPRHRRGWESQRPRQVQADDRSNPCVLVTDGDGSLNLSASPETTYGATVRPRHRRGWESQPHGSNSRRGRATGCVLVTDGDGSLNHLAPWTFGRTRTRASSSPTGMGVSTRDARDDCRVPDRASSSPTGMGVSTTTRRRDGSACWCVRPRHRRGWESQHEGAVEAG